MKIAVCFLSTIENHFNLEVLRSYALRSEYDIDVYEYIDSNFNKDEDERVYFTYDYLMYRFNYNHKFYNESSKTKDKSGLQFLPYLDMCVRHIDEYDMFMFYEDDVSCFSNLFTAIDWECDFVFQDRRKRVGDYKSWFWATQEHSIEGMKAFGLLNVYAGNKKAVECILDYIKNNYGHHEMLISSCIVNNNDIKIHYIGDYMSTYMTFINNPEKMLFNIRSLMHPIKTKELYNEILKIY